ncbi:hypothetical protein KAJ27_18120 [bacterium]|nr:hypothetical protein [bacterium]
MIEKMSKIEMLFLSKDIDNILLFLQKTALLHIEEVATPAEGKLHFQRFHVSDELARKIDKYKNINQHIEHIHKLFNQNITSLERLPELDFKIDIQKVSTKVRNLDKKFSKFSRRRKNLDSDLKELKQYVPAKEAISKGIMDYNGSFSEAHPIAVLAIPEEDVHLVRIVEEIVQRTVKSEEYEIIRVNFSTPRPTIAVMVYCDEKYSGNVREDLWEEGFSELMFPNYSSGMSIKETISDFERLINEIPKNVTKIDDSIKTLFNSNSKYLCDSYHAIGASLNRYDFYPSVAQTEQCIIVNGWIPEVKLIDFEKSLEDCWGETAILNELGIIHDEIESIPTLYKNPKFSNRFENLLKLFPPAAYGSYDPTVLNSLTFPLFFGFMLGDIGYGLLIVGLACYLLKKLDEPFGFVGTIMLYCGISSVVFGVIYWEFLGDMIDNIRLFSFLPLLHRQHHVKELMIISMLIGGVHISMGFIIGALKELSKKKTKKALGEISVVVFIWSTFIIVGSLNIFAVLPSYMLSPSILIMVASMVIIFITSGFFSIMELFSTLSNILSYTRLMAIGFSSVILANIANVLGNSVSNVIIGILTGLIFHLINLVLGMFGPTIHALRLHYVEFMPKFYEASGKDYKPFEYNLNNF